MYLVLSLLCTAVQEWIAQISGWRQRHLENAVSYLLDDSTMKDNPESRRQAEEILKHPLVKLLTTEKKTLFSSWSQKPAYIPARNFALALIDVLGASKQGQQVTLATLSQAVSTTTNQAVKGALQPVIATAGADPVATVGTTDPSKAIAGIEAWYDSAMDRASGWYKRQVQWSLLFMGLAVALVTNADTIQVATHLATDSELRDRVASLAAATAPPDAQTEQAIKKLSEQLAKDLDEGNLVAGFGDLPVGWALCGGAGTGWANFNPTTCYPSKLKFDSHIATAWVYKALGLLLTALAASLGAPFWFGLLQQLNAARSSGPKPATTTSAQP